MKKTPDQQRAQENLAPGPLSADGFVGTDPRDLSAIVAADQETVDRLGTTHAAIAEGLRRLTRIGAAEFGRPVAVGPSLEVAVEESRGTIPCPFSDASRSLKRYSVLTDAATGRTLSWTDLNLHLIERHGFYEGQGSPFRVDPAEAAALLARVRVREE
jgi:hypothetical protein